MYDNSLTSTVVKCWWESISEAQLFRTTVRWFWFLDKYQCFCSPCKKMSQKNFRNPVFYFLTVQLFMRSSRRDCRTPPPPEKLTFVKSQSNIYQRIGTLGKQIIPPHVLHEGRDKFEDMFWRHWICDVTI